MEKNDTVLFIRPLFSKEEDAKKYVAWLYQADSLAGKTGPDLHLRKCADPRLTTYRTTFCSRFTGCVGPKIDLNGFVWLYTADDGCQRANVAFELIRADLSFT